MENGGILAWIYLGKSSFQGMMAGAVSLLDAGHLDQTSRRPPCTSVTKKRGNSEAEILGPPDARDLDCVYVTCAVLPK